MQEATPKSSSLLYFPKTVFSKRFGKQFFTMDITGFEVADKDSCWNKHAEYVLTLKQGKSEWTVKRRFSEFDAFSRDVHGLLPDDPSLAPLPPKTCRSHLEDQFLQDRREKLYDFLDITLKELSQKNLITNESIVKFLEIDPNVPPEES
jgi:hypothetical protein